MASTGGLPAIPISPMISVPQKKTEEVNLAGPIKDHILQVYQMDPEAFANEIKTLQRYRQDTRGIGRDANARDILFRYYSQLEFLDLRIPINEQGVKILFTWNDAFTNKPTSQYSIAFEKACVLFNLAATVSQMADLQNRLEPEGLKMAYNYFQAAAGLFNFLNENFLHAPSVDMSQDSNNFFMAVMLAQAQECFFEKVVAENKRPQMISKIANQASLQYKVAHDALLTKLQQHYDKKGWVWMILAKYNLYLAVAHYYAAFVAEDEKRYGEVVARLIAADNKIKEAQKSAEKSWDVPVPLVDLVKYYSRLISEKKKGAEKDNDIIYHEPVPGEASLVLDKLNCAFPLPLIRLFPDVANVVGKDLFSKLIPITVHEAASFYSEEKAKILRSQVDLVNSADDAFAQTLEVLDIAGLLKEVRGRATGVPPEILQKAAQVREEEKDDETVGLIQTLTAMKSRTKDLLEEASDLLEIEHNEYEQIKLKYGAQLTQRSPKELMKPFWDQAKKIQDDWDKANNADVLLLTKYDEFRENISFLAGPPIALENCFPSASLIDSPYDDQTLNKTEFLVDSLKGLKINRNQTLQELRDMVQKEDISELLVLNKENEDALFKEELVKFQPFIDKIKQNVETTTSLLRELKACHSQILKDKGSDSALIKKERLTRQFNAAYKTFQDVRSGLRQGTDYHSKQSDLCEEFLLSVKNMLQTRREERKMILKHIETTEAARKEERLKKQLSQYEAMETSAIQAQMNARAPQNSFSMPAPALRAGEHPYQRPPEPRHTPPQPLGSGLGLDFSSTSAPPSTSSLMQSQYQPLHQTNATPSQSPLMSPFSPSPPTAPAPYQQPASQPVAAQAPPQRGYHQGNLLQSEPNTYQQHPLPVSRTSSSNAPQEHSLPRSYHQPPPVSQEYRQPEPNPQQGYRPAPPQQDYWPQSNGVTPKSDLFGAPQKPQASSNGVPPVQNQPQHYGQPPPQHHQPQPPQHHQPLHSQQQPFPQQPARQPAPPHQHLAPPPQHQAPPPQPYQGPPPHQHQAPPPQPYQPPPQRFSQPPPKQYQQPPPQHHQPPPPPQHQQPPPPQHFSQAPPPQQHQPPPPQQHYQPQNQPPPQHHQPLPQHHQPPPHQQPFAHQPPQPQTPPQQQPHQPPLQQVPFPQHPPQHQVPPQQPPQHQVPPPQHYQGLPSQQHQPPPPQQHHHQPPPLQAPHQPASKQYQHPPPPQHFHQPSPQHQPYQGPPPQQQPPNQQQSSHQQFPPAKEYGASSSQSRPQIPPTSFSQPPQPQGYPPYQQQQQQQQPPPQLVTPQGYSPYQQPPPHQHPPPRSQAPVQYPPYYHPPRQQEPPPSLLD